MSEEKQTITSLIDLAGSASTADLQNALRILDTQSIPFFGVADPSCTTYGPVSQPSVTAIKTNGKALVRLPYFEDQISIRFIDHSPPMIFDNAQLRQVIYLHQVQVQEISEPVLSLIRKRSVEAIRGKIEPIIELPRLRNEIDAYIDQKSSSVTEKSLHEYKAALSTFLEVLGNIPVNELSTESYGEFIKVLKRIDLLADFRTR